MKKFKKEGIAAIAFDLRQNLQSQEVSVQELFYLSLLSVNLFCVHDLKKEKAFFYICHEGIAAKGANEVSKVL